MTSVGVGVGITGREPRMHARVDAKHAQANANAQMQASMNILSRGGANAKCMACRASESAQDQR